MHSEFMHEALEEAHRAFDAGEIPVGAVVVKDGRIIARAHNLVESSGDATAHAEVLAIRRACVEEGDWRLDGCKLYVTLEPCPMCAGAILNSRISELVFGAYDPQMGCCWSRTDLTSGGLPRKTKTVGGVLEQECRELLTAFFRDKK